MLREMAGWEVGQTMRVTLVSRNSQCVTDVLVREQGAIVIPPEWEELAPRFAIIDGSVFPLHPIEGDTLSFRVSPAKNG